MRPQVPEGYFVRYTYLPAKEPTFEEWSVGAPAPLRSGRSVLALIFDNNLPGAIQAVGQAWCGPRDNYNKRVGRDIALGRALKSLNSHVFPLAG